MVSIYLHRRNHALLVVCHPHLFYISRHNCIPAVVIIIKWMDFGLSVDRQDTHDNEDMF